LGGTRSKYWFTFSRSNVCCDVLQRVIMLPIICEEADGDTWPSAVSGRADIALIRPTKVAPRCRDVPVCPRCPEKLVLYTSKMQGLAICADPVLLYLIIDITL
jgi:hypothetical protein